MPRWPSRVMPPSSSTSRYLARRRTAFIVRPAIIRSKVLATRRRRRGSRMCSATILRPHADCSSIRRSDSTSGSSGIAAGCRADGLERVRQAHEVLEFEPFGALGGSDVSQAQRRLDLFRAHPQSGAEGVAQILAPDRESGPNRIDQHGAQLGRAEGFAAGKEAQHFGVDLGARMEAAGLDPEVLRNFPIQRGQCAQRAIGVLSGAGAQTLAHFALEHQHHPIDQIARVAELAQDGGGDVKGQVADHLDRRTAHHAAQIDCEEIRFDQVGLVCQSPAQPRAKAAVHFDQMQRGNRRGQDALAEDAQSRSDLDHFITRAQVGQRHDAIGNRALHQKVLAAPLTGRDTGGTQCAGGRLGGMRAARRRGLTFCSHAQSGRLASASMSSGSRSPRSRRQLPAIAIIAALSVQYLSDGATTRRPSSAAACVSRSRRRVLAATPPVSTIVETLNWRAAASVGRISISTTVSWKLAAKSSAATPTAASLRKKVATAVLIPLKLKSRGAPLTRARGSRMRLWLPRRLISSIILPPGYPSAIILATLSKASPAASSRVRPTSR